MGWARVVLALVAVVAAAGLLVSGDSGADPETPAGLPGLPPPFLGTAVVGGGGLTAAVDSYGDVVDLRAPGPAGRALIDNPSDRQAAGTVPADTGIVPRVRLDAGPWLPLWRAGSVRQRYLAGTNVVRTVGDFGGVRVAVTAAADATRLALRIRVRTPHRQRVETAVGIKTAARCAQESGADELVLVCSAGRPPRGVASKAVDKTISSAAASDRTWLQHARPLGPGAPTWAEQMYHRSLLVLRALTDRRTGAVAAGARDGWAYVWPRDAATAALALSAAGFGGEARRIASFLSQLLPDAAARYGGDGSPIPGRAPQGDAKGWIAVAAAAAGARAGGGPGGHFQRSSAATPSGPSTNALPDYREGNPGTYLGNVIATGVPAPEIAELFGTRLGLVRTAGDPSSGLDSAAAWAIRPFARPSLYRQARRTLLHLIAAGTPYGITPGEGWAGGEDPWTAPTAWSAWSLAALGDRGAALRLLGDLRRAATPAGALPERVDARSGIPRSTTPLAWSEAFAILALRELWPAEPARR